MSPAGFSRPPPMWDGYGVARRVSRPTDRPSWIRLSADPRALAPFVHAGTGPVQALRVMLAADDTPDALWGLWDAARAVRG